MTRTSLPIIVTAGIFSAFFVSAAQQDDVLINEIAWMGTESSYSDEWIELKNDTDKDINLEGWKLEAADGSPDIYLKGVIPAKGFYLLERTDDDTLPSLKADLIYKGALGNEGEALTLFDSYGNLIDRADKWSAGDNNTKQTMSRLNNGQWLSSLNPGGTPKLPNDFAEPEAAEIMAETQEATSTEAAKPEITFPTAKKDSAEPSAVPYFVAGAIALASGATALLLKNKE